MRTLLVRIDGEVENGDLVILQCSSRIPGGQAGQSNARGDVRAQPDRIEVINGHKTIVEDKPKMADLVAKLASEINFHWGAGFHARQRNEHEIVVQIEGFSQDVVFSHTIEGSMKQTVSIEDLA
jgi:hypothetical protein